MTFRRVFSAHSDHVCHIPSLQAYAALAAQPQLDPDVCKRREEKKTCENNRGRLSISLRTWCDDFYGDLFHDETDVKSHDAAWIATVVTSVPYSTGRTSPSLMVLG